MANNHYDEQNPGQKQAQVAVVMVPLLAQGHLNQLLQLSRIIASYDIPVHYVSTTTHNRQARLRVHGWDPLSIKNIHFHEFAISSFPSPPPDPNAAIKFPSHLLPSFHASSELREPVAAVLSTLSGSSRRIIVINDSAMASIVQDVVSIPNAEAYTFHSVSAFNIFWGYWESMGKPFEVEPETLKFLPSLEGCVTSELMEFFDTQTAYMKFSSGYLYNTCKVIEGQYMAFLEKLQISSHDKQWAIGPFNPVVISDNMNSNQRHECLKWLDKQPPNSVIFVSFGTTTSLTDEQIQELAIGLEQSEQKFIWVLRDADKGDIFNGEERRAELPKGYEDRVEGKGMVVRDWAPQLEILGHPSTGGFLSHCGWNSCMESISMGVPIAAWPMHSDQPRNTLLITNVLKIGIVVMDWAHRDELVTSLTVVKAIKRLMASKEGDDIRKRAKELSHSVKRSVEEGGVTRMELDSFITHITR